MLLDLEEGETWIILEVPEACGNAAAAITLANQQQR